MRTHFRKKRTHFKKKTISFIANTPHAQAACKTLSYKQNNTLPLQLVPGFGIEALLFPVAFPHISDREHHIVLGGPLWLCSSFASLLHGYEVHLNVFVRAPKRHSK